VPARDERGRLENSLPEESGGTSSHRSSSPPLPRFPAIGFASALPYVNVDRTMLLAWCRGLRCEQATAVRPSPTPTGSPRRADFLRRRTIGEFSPQANASAKSGRLRTVPFTIGAAQALKLAPAASERHASSVASAHQVWACPLVRSSDTCPPPPPPVAAGAGQVGAQDRLVDLGAASDSRRSQIHHLFIRRSCSPV
jgi:hypothetical protein